MEETPEFNEIRLYSHISSFFYASERSIAWTEGVLSHHFIFCQLGELQSYQKSYLDNPLWRSTVDRNCQPVRLMQLH